MSTDGGAMRILHTSDWHLGRTLRGVDLLEHQASFIDHLVELVVERKIDAVVVAGDIYDRAMPSVPTVKLLSDALRRLNDVAAVILTPGNHDSAVRVGFAAELMRSGLHILADASRMDVPVLIPDEHGEVAFYGLPYLDPDTMRGSFPESNNGDPLARSHEAVTHAAMERVRADLAARDNVRSIVIAHAFVVGGVTSESERDIRAISRFECCPVECRWRISAQSSNLMTFHSGWWPYFQLAFLALFSVGVNTTWRTRYSTTSRSSTTVNAATHSSDTRHRSSTNYASTKHPSLPDLHTARGNQAVGHVKESTEPTAVPSRIRTPLGEWARYQRRAEEHLCAFQVLRLYYWALLMRGWVRGDPINRVISSSIAYYTQRGSITYRDYSREESLVTEPFDRKSARHVNLIIEWTLRDIEGGLRFRIIGYLQNFFDVSVAALGREASGINVATLVEYGTTDQREIQLQEVGFGRTVATELLTDHLDSLQFSKADELEVFYYETILASSEISDEARAEIENIMVKVDPKFAG